VGVLIVVYLPDDVGATAYFPASFTGSTALPPAVDSPTWTPVGGPATPQYVTADLFTGATGPSVIVAGDSPSSQHHQAQQQQQQVPAQPVHVIQPYPQHVSVMTAPPPTTPHQPQHPAGYLQQPAPAPSHLQVCSLSFITFTLMPSSHHRHGHDKIVLSCPCRRCELA